MSLVKYSFELDKLVKELKFVPYKLKKNATYEVGKTYTADKETRLLVGTNNQLVTIKAGQNFKVNADGTITILQ